MRKLRILKGDIAVDPKIESWVPRDRSITIGERARQYMLHNYHLQKSGICQVSRGTSDQNVGLFTPNGFAKQAHIGT